MKLTNTISDLLSASLNEGFKNPSVNQTLIELLMCYGCDYYEIVEQLSTIMSMKCPLEDVKILQSLAPAGRSLKNLDSSSIRSMIPRWTATRYHTGPISFVIKDIQNKCFSRQVGCFSYHSNFNPRKKSVDDPYVLLSTDQKIVFLDINRKRNFTYAYLEEGEVETC